MRIHGYDKQCARQHKRRVPERTLFLVAGFFGSTGGTIGMHVFARPLKAGLAKMFERRRR